MSGSILGKNNPIQSSQKHPLNHFHAKIKPLYLFLWLLKNYYFKKIRTQYKTAYKNDFVAGR